MGDRVGVYFHLGNGLKVLSIATWRPNRDRSRRFGYDESANRVRRNPCGFPCHSAPHIYGGRYLLHERVTTLHLHEDSAKS